MKRARALVVVSWAWLVLACGPELPIRSPLIVLPDGMGKTVERSIRVPVGQGVMVQLPRIAEHVATRGVERVAHASLKGDRVWVIGLAPGVTQLDVAGKEDVLARLEVRVEPAPLPKAAEPAAPAVIQIDAGPEATARWTLESGHGSVLRLGFELKSIFVADPEVVDFIVNELSDVQLIAKRSGVTNLVLESDDDIELLAELSVVDAGELETPQRPEGAVFRLPGAPGSKWDSAAIELDSGVTRKLEASYAFKRVAVSDPCVADFSVLADHEVVLEAHDAGRTRVFVWDEHGVRSVLDLQVSSPQGGASSASPSDLLSAIRIDSCVVRNDVARCRREPTNPVCPGLGRQVRDGKIVAEDATLAARLFEQGCGHGHRWACAALAGLELAASRSARAEQLLDEACAAESRDESDPCALARALRACPDGDAPACTRLGDAFDDAFSLGRNLELERRYHQQACQLGDGNGCLGLGLSYFDVESEQTRVAELMERACDLDIGEGCAQTGYRYLWARGVAKDVPRALRALVRGCTRRSATACRQLVAHYGSGESEDAARALEFALKGCDLDDGVSCYSAALAYQYGDGVRRDGEKSRELHARACELGEKSGCDK